MAFFSNDYPERMPLLERIGKEWRFRKAVKGGLADVKAMAVHDGCEIEGPIEPNQVKEDKVYQRIIDNRTEGGLFEDLRVVVINGHVPVVYQKRKTGEVRYTNETAEVDLVESPKSVLSEAEIAQIASLSAKMCAEFAELDVLRDRQDGRIYCVDLNPTPYGPPAGLGQDFRQRALDKVRNALRS